MRFLAPVPPIDAILAKVSEVADHFRYYTELGQAAFSTALADLQIFFNWDF